MLWHSLCKLVQRQTYTCLSHKFGIYVAYAGVVIVLYSFFHFSEELLVWSQNKYDVAFGAYHNNIAAKSFQNRLCSEVPIDIVYTWVNGSDPLLLKQLNELKDKISTNLTSQQNENTVVQCNFKDCIKLPLLVMLPSVGGLTTDIAKNTYSNCDNLQSVFSLVLSKDVLLTSEAQATFLRFETIDEVRTVQQMNNGTNQNLTLAHVTSDVSSPHSMQLKSAFILTSIPKTFKTEREVKEQLPAILKDKLEWMYYSSSTNLAFIWLTDSALVDDFANEKGNSTLKFGFAMGNSYSKVEVKLAYLVGRIEAHGSDDVISRSRFEDNEELRYSLRSVVKYAPWVRHIYIVTNGQIPYWLNMDAPRISVITHDEIFVNKSHLPTFSSPAIEAHLHRIPGLADKFIYLNDDVMFGKEVWPDDFYTHAEGYKVYLAWSVPNCAEGCAPSWITDGYCDAACNVSECDWDGGDCTGPNVKPGVGGGGNYAGRYSWRSTVSYCKPGCSNSWIADKFCDQACNTYECGFDAADCGLSNYQKAYKLPGLTNGTTYLIPDGQHMAYFDLSKTFSKVSLASYDKNDNIRTAAVSNKFKVLTIVFHVNGNQSEVAFNISGTPVNTTSEPLKGDAELETVCYQFKVQAYPANNITNNTVNVDKAVIGNVTQSNDVVQDVAATEQYYDEIIEIPEEFKRPQIMRRGQKDEIPSLPVSMDHVNMSILPLQVQTKYAEYKNESEAGYLTKRGYQRNIHQLLSPYFEILQQTYINMTNENENLNANAHSHNRGDPGLIQQVNNDVGMHKIGQLRKDVRTHQREVFNRLFQRVEQSEVARKPPNSSENMNSPISRKLLSVAGLKEPLITESQDEILHDQPQNMGGFLPWEADKQMVNFQLKFEENERKKSVLERYNTSFKKRKLLDTFGDSLLFVSRLFNKRFGFTQRKVPAHMPHMVDKNIMYELQGIYPHEYDMTSSHRLRHSQDMQFAFSYFYYIMSELKSFDSEQVFDELDTDHSKVLSDREIRLLATQIFDLPLTLDELTSVETAFKQCAMDLYGDHKLNMSLHNISEVTYNQPTAGLEAWAVAEIYYDKDMPLVTKEVLLSCDYVMEKLNKTYSGKKKYNYVQLDESEVSFKMIRSNVSVVVGQLDDIRKHPKKFICLNDNIDHNSKEAHTVKAVLQDFYETLFPIQSQFELSHDYRNRFGNIFELREWKTKHERTLFLMHCILVILLVSIVISFFWDQIYRWWRKHRHRLFRRGILNPWKTANKSRDPV